MNKTTLKARFGSDIRKNWIHHSNDISLNDLVTKMQRYFDIKDANAIKLKYRDQENDWVNLVDDDDLAYALASMELLYVDVAVDEKQKMKQDEPAEKIAPLVEASKAVAPPRGATPVDNAIGELTEIPLNGPASMFGQQQPQYQFTQQTPIPAPQQTPIPPPQQTPMPPPQQTPMPPPQQTPMPPPPVSGGGMFYGQSQQPFVVGGVPTMPLQHNQPPQQTPLQLPPVSGGGMFYGQSQPQQPFAGGGVSTMPPQQPSQQPPQQTPMPPPPVSGGGVFYGQNPFSRQNR